MKIAILGAQSTGKTQLTHTLTQALVRRVDNTPPENFSIADTPALMAAIYRDVLFDDSSLYPAALDNHRGYDLTLVMGLDLLWVADGVQRRGAHSRIPVDTRLREILEANAVRYSVIYGIGTHRNECALQAIAHSPKKPGPTLPSTPSKWKWSCEQCSDSDCEHRLFSELVRRDSVGG